MVDLVENFNTFKKNVASDKRRRVEQRKDKTRELFKQPVPHLTTTRNTDQYRSGWDKVFGKKTGDSLSRPDNAEAKEASPDLRDAHPAGS